MLVLTGISIAMITTAEDKPQIHPTLGDGKHKCLHFARNLQTIRHDLAEIYVLAEDFPTGNVSLIVLDEDIFIDQGLPELLSCAVAEIVGGKVFANQVADSQRCGALDFGTDARVSTITVKSDVPPIYAVTGLACPCYPAPKTAARVTSSKLGNRELLSPLRMYFDQVTLSEETTRSGSTWRDTVTYKSLQDAGNCVHTLTERNGTQVDSPKKNVINENYAKKNKLREIYLELKKCGNGVHLHTILKAKSK